ncbi:unnamed protein product [Bursaphelenchus xylophilus]|uniref:(pine wood nematode) hypothetical protein n=1 Tax=Bursaphelenchus xylophilus TaxID=6326 RepID=A0A1I7RL88_BURXY|nr:unnamed protein product [Bursaphelenchus xylophilus]CAG9083301.1 unnamed protein product [Bursaphelenchus xylophilus]
MDKKILELDDGGKITLHMNFQEHKGLLVVEYCGNVSFKKFEWTSEPVQKSQPKLGFLSDEKIGPYFDPYKSPSSSSTKSPVKPSRGLQTKSKKSSYQCLADLDDVIIFPVDEPRVPPRTPIKKQSTNKKGKKSRKESQYQNLRELAQNK